MTLDLTEREEFLLREILSDTMLLTTLTPGLVKRVPNCAETLNALMDKVKVKQQAEG